MSLDRKTHLQWAKDRARQYTKVNDLPQAVSSFVSDMRKHPELEDHLALSMLTQMYFGGQLSTPEKLQEYIDGFN